MGQTRDAKTALEREVQQFLPMRCLEIMHRRVCSVRETDNLAIVAHTMREENVGFVPVVDSDDVVVGTLTDRDIVVRACVGGTDPRDVTAGEVMTRGVVFCRPRDTVESAENKMRRHHITRLPVIDEDGAIVGVLSLSDLAQYDVPGRLGRTLQAITERKYAF